MSSRENRTPRGQRGRMMLMSDEEMKEVEVKRELKQSSTLPSSSREVAATPTRLDLGRKRPHSSLDGGGGSDSKVSVKISPPAKKKKKKTRTPTGTGPNTSSQRAATAGAAGAADGVVTEAPSVQPAGPGAAHRDGRGAGDGVEVVRQVGVEERIAENQRRQGVIDIRDGNGLTPPSLPLEARARPISPKSAARAAARRGGGGGDSARSGGGVSCNLAMAEGWAQAAPSSMSVPVKLEASASQGTGNNVSAGPPGSATPVVTSAAPAPAAPAPAATPPPANGGDGGRNVSVSDMFRLRGVWYDVRTASKVGMMAKRMDVRPRVRQARRETVVEAAGA